jgi:hypothetical protein
MAKLETEINQLSLGNQPTPETMTQAIAKMPLVIGADGVMIPMRPHPGKPDGKTQWREVKVAILSRLGQGITRKGREFFRLLTHQSHINYQRYKELGLPLGSGMVESACKWLIQQRFKSVDMRWSKPSFNPLLHLRLAWVNGRFDELFYPVFSASPKP